MAAGLRTVEGYLNDTGGAMIDPRKIIIEPGFNPRSPEEFEKNVVRLMPKIEAAGAVLEPVVLRKDGDRAVLVAGHSRVEALKRLIASGNPKFQDAELPNGKTKIVGIPAIYKQGVSNELDRLVYALLENESNPLTDADKGRAFARFFDAGWTMEEVQAQTGNDARYINSCIVLNQAPAEVKAAVADGSVTRGAAVAAVKEHGSKAAEVLKKAVEDSPKGEPVKRAKKPASKDVLYKNLFKAAAALLGEADLQRDAMVVEIHRDHINALRVAAKALKGEKK